MIKTWTVTLARLLEFKQIQSQTFVSDINSFSKTKITTLLDLSYIDTNGKLISLVRYVTVDVMLILMHVQDGHRKVGFCNVPS